MTWQAICREEWKEMWGESRERERRTLGKREILNENYGKEQYDKIHCFENDIKYNIHFTLPTPKGSYQYVHSIKIRISLIYLSLDYAAQHIKFNN